LRLKSPCATSQSSALSNNFRSADDRKPLENYHGEEVQEEGQEVIGPPRLVCGIGQYFGAASCSAIVLKKRVS
jgi:hypothetical protein